MEEGTRTGWVRGHGSRDARPSGHGERTNLGDLQEPGQRSVEKQSSRNSQGVGTNQPNLKFDSNGRRHYVEYGTATSGLLIVP